MRKAIEQLHEYKHNDRLQQMAAREHWDGKRRTRERERKQKQNEKQVSKRDKKKAVKQKKQTSHTQGRVQQVSH